MRIPKEAPEPLGKRKRAPTRGRSKSKAAEEEVEVRIVHVPKENPEEGWDDDTETQCVVLDFPTAEEVARRMLCPCFTSLSVLLMPLPGIALTSSMVHPVPAANNDWAFMKVFGDADFIAAGVLVIPPKGRKPSKSTKDNTYVRRFNQRQDLSQHRPFVVSGLLCHRRRRQLESPQHKSSPRHRGHVSGTARYIHPT